MKDNDDETAMMSLLQDITTKNGRISGNQVANMIREQDGFPTLRSALWESASHDALRSVGGLGLSHDAVCTFVDELGERLHGMGCGRGDRVVVLLPNGPILALALASLMNWVTCIPLNPQSTVHELAEDVKRVGATWVLVLPNLQSVVEGLGLPIVTITAIPGTVGLFDTQPIGSCQSDSSVDSRPNGLDDHALLLFTSGTTGNKRIVPHTLENILTGATLIASSWQLSPTDVCFNMMPLYHVGGILRQVIAPLVSGGCVMCGECFDPFLFWDLLQAKRFTWYYAAPTMHHVILQSQPPHSTTGDWKLRFLANAAGGLSPTLAEQLSQVFYPAHVLPSYGSTECMPITSPPADYRLEKPGTSGIPVGPELKIVDPNDLTKELPVGSEGCICVRGAPCFKGYLQSSNEGVFSADGFFNTGDLGHVDKDGYLFISGRMKEVINRGGEIISPMDVEECVSQYPDISMCMAFSVGHDVLQEVVGIAVVPNEGASVSLPLIHEFLRGRLTSVKWPQCLVVMDDLPKSHTNKLFRVGFAKRLGLATLMDSTPLCKRSFRAQCPEQGSALNQPISIEMLEKSVTETDKLGPGDDEANGQLSGPSNALNGVRFVVGCFVVFGHIGIYPSVVMLKLQAYSLAMQIFFFLAAFQMSCKIQNEVLSTWSVFVGTKIGSLHALFVTTQLIALLPFLLFHCGTFGYDETFKNQACNADNALARPLALWFVNTVTGLVGTFTFDEVNSTNWFMGVLYTYILAFPLLHSRIQRILSSYERMILVFLVFATAAIAVPGLCFLFFGYFELNYTIITWIFALLSASVAGIFFSHLQGFRASNCTFHSPQNKFMNQILVYARSPKYWGIATDTMSVVMLVLAVGVALSPQCLYVDEETYENMRPGEELPLDTILSFDQTPMYWVCDVNFDEWDEHIKDTCGSGGRWVTQVAKYFRFGRLGSPIVWIWLFGIAFGQGATARLMNCRFLQFLSPLAYPLYLLHVPIAQLYWLATRGLEAQEWWDCPGNVPIPINWYELILVICLCLALGFLLDRYLLPHLIPKTIQCWVTACRKLSSALHFRSKTDALAPDKDTESSLNQISNMIRAGTGIEVTRSTHLSNTGLDSLGLTALLGNIRATVPSARNLLTLRQLAAFTTVGELSDFLDDAADTSGERNGSSFDPGQPTHWSPTSSDSSF